MENTVDRVIPPTYFMMYPKRDIVAVRDAGSRRFVANGIRGHWRVRLEISVAVDDELAQLTRRTHQRAGARVHSRVAVAAEWTEAGQAARVEGHTIDVSSRGCQVVLPRELVVGRRLRLTNLLNERVCEATVVWCGPQGQSGWELGLELQADGNFWGGIFHGAWED